MLGCLSGAVCPKSMKSYQQKTCCPVGGPLGLLLGGCHREAPKLAPRTPTVLIPATPRLNCCSLLLRPPTRGDCPRPDTTVALTATVLSRNRGPCVTAAFTASAGFEAGGWLPEPMAGAGRRRFPCTVTPAQERTGLPWQGPRPPQSRLGEQCRRPERTRQLYLGAPKS